MLRSMAAPRDGYRGAQHLEHHDYTDLDHADKDARWGKVKVGKESPSQRVTYDPRASMAFDSAKGLLNPSGENNCFLNSAVQVLWNLDTFRRSFRLLTGHACLGTSCIFCPLKAIFNQYQFSSHPALPAAQLRDALAESFADQRRYQLGFMDDAAECFENILMRIHTHLAHGVSEDACQVPHCIPHQKFAMTVVEQAVCECGETCEPFAFSQIVNYVSTGALRKQARSDESFGRLLGSAASEAEERKCPVNCGGRVLIRRTLTNTPDVISIGFVWDSDQPSSKHINQVVCSIETTLHPAEMFYSLVDADWAVSTRFNLVGVVCYYGQHYTTFFFHSKMKIWILFDDSRVKKLGPNWKRVVEKCCQGKYQPLLLLYANSESTAIDDSSAPTTIVRLREEPKLVERPRDMVRRSLLAQRFVNQGPADSLPSTFYAQTFLQSQSSKLNNSSLKKDQPEHMTATMRNSYLLAVNETDESCDSDRNSTLSRTSNCDTFSSSSSSRSNSAYDKESIRCVANCQDGVGPQSSEAARSQLNTGNLWKSAVCQHLDHSDSEPYISKSKVEEILQKQVKKRATQRFSVTGVGRGGDYLDSLSITSHKDSGYRSNEDRLSSTSPLSSPTRSASASDLNLAHATFSQPDPIVQFKTNGSGLSSQENPLSSQTVIPKVPLKCENPLSSRTVVAKVPLKCENPLSSRTVVAKVPLKCEKMQQPVIESDWTASNRLHYEDSVKYSSTKQPMKFISSDHVSGQGQLCNYGRDAQFSRTTKPYFDTEKILSNLNLNDEQLHLAKLSLKQSSSYCSTQKHQRSVESAPGQEQVHLQCHDFAKYGQLEKSAYDTAQLSLFSQYEQFRKPASNAVQTNLGQATKYECPTRSVTSAVATSQAAMTGRSERHVVPAYVLPAGRTPTPSSVVRQWNRPEAEVKPILAKYPEVQVDPAPRFQECVNSVPSYPYTGQTDVTQIVVTKHQEQLGVKGRRCGVEPRSLPPSAPRTLPKKRSIETGRGVPAAVSEGLGRIQTKSASSSTTKPSWRV